MTKKRSRAEVVKTLLGYYAEGYKLPFERFEEMALKKPVDTTSLIIGNVLFVLLLVDREEYYSDLDDEHKGKVPLMVAYPRPWIAASGYCDSYSEDDMDDEVTEAWPKALVAFGLVTEKEVQDCEKQELKRSADEKEKATLRKLAEKYGVTVPEKLTVKA